MIKSDILTNRYSTRNSYNDTLEEGFEIQNSNFIAADTRLSILNQKSIPKNPGLHKLVEHTATVDINKNEKVSSVQSDFSNPIDMDKEPEKF